MATTYYEVIKLVFEIKPDYTEVEVWCGPASDGLLGVQGVHKKTFPKDRDVISILQKEIAHQDYLTW
jgi:hypothetical protein